MRHLLYLFAHRQTSRERERTDFCARQGIALTGSGAGMFAGLLRSVQDDRISILFRYFCS